MLLVFEDMMKECGFGGETDASLLIVSHDQIVPGCKYNDEESRSFIYD